MLVFLELLLALLQFMLGAALFSFLNVVAWRLPRGMKIAADRSICPTCGATLDALDLVPVFSWLFLRGKCRHCGARIPVRYLLVELLGGLVALGCRWRFGTGLTLPEGLFGMSWAALWALVLVGLLATISLIDAETQTIPDRLNFAVGVCGLLAFFVQPQVSSVSRLIGALCISVPMLLLCFVIEGAFGGGDIKLIAAAGLCLGWQNTLVAAFFGIVLGGGYGIYLLAAHKKARRDHFAFGPFLCTGIALALFFGEAILRWYLQFF